MNKKSSRTNSEFYLPRSKAALIEAIRPGWKGKKTELYQFSLKRLAMIYRRMRQETWMGLMRDKKTGNDLANPTR